MSLDVRVKEEPGCYMGLLTDRNTDEYCIKEEREYDSSLSDADAKIEAVCGVSAEAAQDGLYADHQIKDELVLGPEVVQRLDKTSIAIGALESLDQSSRNKSNQWQSQGIPDDIPCEPFCGNSAPSKFANKLFALRDCSVRLERLDLNSVTKPSSSNQGSSFNSHQHSNIDGSKRTRNSTTQDTVQVVNSKGKIYICDVCGKLFTGRKAITSHLITHMAQKPYSCDICQKKFAVKKYLRKHISVHSDQPFACNICDTRFSRKHTMIRHQIIHNTDKHVSCEVCGKKFAWEKSLNRHKLIHAGEKPYFCEICENIFRYKHSLIVHMRTHAGENTSSLDASNHKITHKRLRTGNKAHICDICGKHYKYVSSLNTHKNNHLSGVRKNIQCGTCGKNFSARGGLNRHNKLVHLKEQPFSCEICNKRFARKETLISHSQIHTGQKPYICNICEKQFSYRPTYMYHLRQHSGCESLTRTKNTHLSHSCEICENKFNSKTRLTVHMRVHTGEKPFSCEVCKKCFRHKSTLIAHMRTHTGELPYACNMCSQKCITSSNLSSHKRKWHY